MMPRKRYSVGGRNSYSGVASSLLWCQNCLRPGLHLTPSLHLHTHLPRKMRQQVVQNNRKNLPSRPPHSSFPCPLDSPIYTINVECLLCTGTVLDNGGEGGRGGRRQTCLYMLVEEGRINDKQDKQVTVVCQVVSVLWRKMRSRESCRG